MYCTNVLRDTLVPIYVDMLERGCWFFLVCGLDVYSFFFLLQPPFSHVSLPPTTSRWSLL